MSNSSQINEADDIARPVKPPISSIVHLSKLLWDRRLDHKFNFFLVISSAPDIRGDYNKPDSASNLLLPVMSESCSSRAKHPIVSLEIGCTSRPDATSSTGAFDTKQLVPLLDYCVKQVAIGNSPKHVLVDFNLSQPASNQQPICQQPRYSHIRHRTTSNKPIAKQIQARLEDELRQCRDSQSATNVILKGLMTKLSKLLVYQLEEFKPEESIAQYGVDSLVAAELRTWINLSVGASIEILDILSPQPMIELARELSARSRLVGPFSENGQPITNGVHGKDNGLHGSKPMNAITNGDSTSRDPGPTRTLQFQASLPKMPIPPLAQTLERYALSLRPLLNGSEYERSLKSIKDFGVPGGAGEDLQNRLTSRSKRPDIKNWLYDYWVDHYYLKPRRPITPATNFFMSHKDAGNQFKISKRAAIICKAVLDFKNGWDNGTLEPALLNGDPICMESYHWMFNTCRIPVIGQDQSVKHNRNNRVVVIRRNRFFTIEGEQCGRNLSVADLEYCFEHILRSAEDDGPAIGILTSENRDLWAAASS